MIFPMIFIVVLLYACGMLAWNQRAFHLYLERVSRPWGEAIERNDWDACRHWRELAASGVLQRWDVMFNPVAWVRYWDWKPTAPPYTADKSQEARFIQ